MISVVIEAGDEEQALAATLASLVPAAAEGFVREVILAGTALTPGAKLIGEELGCTIMDAGRDAGLRAARSEWVLILAPGVRLESDWFREAAVFIERTRRAGARSRAAAFRHAVEEPGWRARLAEAWAWAGARFRASPSLLAHRDALARGLRLRPSRLRARAFVGGLTVD